MGEATLRPGAILYVDFPDQVPLGNEQINERPAILVGFPENLDSPRFPIYIVIPLSSSEDAKRWCEKSPNLYMFLPKGTGKLKEDSVVLLDQIRAVDPTRIKYFIGNLPIGKYREIKKRMKKLLNL